MLLELRICDDNREGKRNLEDQKMVGENGFNSVYPIPCRGDYWANDDFGGFLPWSLSDGPNRTI